MNITISKEVKDTSMGMGGRIVNTMLSINANTGELDIYVRSEKIPLTKSEALLIAKFLQTWAEQQP